MNLRYFSLFIIVVLCTPFLASSQTKKSTLFEFTQLTFYSSACNGTCPDIQMHIFGDRRFEIIRQVFSKKGKRDSVLSGGYTGQMKKASYSLLISLLKGVDWDTLTYNKILCCDGAVKTIALSYNNGKFKRIHSMILPESTVDLTKYLLSFATDKSLVKNSHGGAIDFEVYED